MLSIAVALGLVSAYHSGRSKGHLSDPGRIFRRIAGRVASETFTPGFNSLAAARFLRMLTDDQIAEEIELLKQASWSSEGEDMICNFLFKYVVIPGSERKGFFLDIGAHHPYRFSNTFLFYKHGWRGINVEPNPDVIELFHRVRPEDLTLNIALSDQGGVLTYRRFANSLLNGFFSEEAIKFKGEYLGSIEINALSPKDFLQTYVGEREIDFMSIDVEGFEQQILGSWDWERYRPKLICAEIFGPNVESVQQHEVHRILKREGYVFLSRVWQSSMYGLLPG
jgi:FkbM family methyltransferase